MNIKCKIIENKPCIKCNSIEQTMVRVGVFYMCPTCWNTEFATTEFSTTSEEYKTYVAWLNETEYGK